MTIEECVAAAVIAGVLMGIATEAGYRARVIRGNLIRVDGEFALSRVGINGGSPLIYAAGITVHLVTSAVFGVVLFGIAELIDVSASSAKVIATYVFLLWLAMLFSALPAAGQGLLGRKLGSMVWFEQMILHFMFAVGMWWAFRVL